MVEELDSPAPAASGAAAHPPPGFSEAARAVAVDAHPQCPALWLHRQVRPTGAVSEVLVGVSAIEQVRGAPDWLDGSGSRVLLRAPKHSPPA